MSSSSSSSDDSDASEYFPTPIRHTMAGQTPLASLPNKCSITEIQQLDSFIRKTNRGCERKGCRGKIVPVEVVTENLGGAVKIVYRCRKCSCLRVAVALQRAASNKEIFQWPHRWRSYLLGVLMPHTRKYSIFLASQPFPLRHSCRPFKRCTR